ncbi:MAG: alpha/beta hydrolase [Ferruginibacter sp.]|nr:alpha/beta hydrolase [Ferruginibacter sp.]
MKLKQKIAIGYIRAKFKMITVVSKRLAAEKAFDLFCTPFMKSRVRTPTIFEEAEPMHFELNGLKIHGFRWNHDQPYKILILHGFGSAAHKFHQYISPLVAKGYEVLAFDAPAHGSSEGTRVNAVQYCEMIEKVLSLYGPVNAFLAHSFGGMALSLAIEKSVHTADTKIVLIAPATETSTAVDAAFKMLQLKDPEVRKEFDKIIFEKSGQKTEWFSIKRAMQNITAKVLWLHDEDDDITPLADALTVKGENFPNIRFIITKGLGHRKIYGDLNVKKEVLEFL